MSDFKLEFIWYDESIKGDNKHYFIDNKTYEIKDIRTGEVVGRIKRFPQEIDKKLILNPNKDIVQKVLESIYKNDGHCPCQFEKSDNTLCPCDDFYKGECHCKLFIERE